MTLISLLERYVARPAGRLLLPAAAAVFGYAPLAVCSEASDIEISKIAADLDPIYYKSTEDYTHILTSEKRRSILASYEKYVRAKEPGSARDIMEFLTRALNSAKLTDADKNGFFPYACSLYLRLGMRPFNANNRPPQDYEQKVLSTFNTALVAYARATRCQDRALVMGNILEGLAHKALNYDNDPARAYIMLSIGGYRGAKETTEWRTILAQAQRGAGNGEAVQLVRSFPQFRTMSSGSQNAAVITLADKILAVFDDKKYPCWPFTDVRAEARVRKAYVLFSQGKIKDALSVAESCQTEWPAWEYTSPEQAAQPKQDAASYSAAERAFKNNPLHLGALATMIDSLDAGDAKRQSLIDLLIAIHADGALAQQYKQGNADTGKPNIGAVDKNEPEKGSSVTAPRKPDENE
jgi:hypothetical protein